MTMDENLKELFFIFLNVNYLIAIHDIHKVKVKLSKGIG